MIAALIGAFMAGAFVGAVVTVVIVRRAVRQHDAWRAWFAGQQ